MLPSPVPTVVGSIRVAPVAASIPVAEVSGSAVAGNPATIALAKNATTINSQGETKIGYSSKGIGARMCDSWVEKL